VKSAECHFRVPFPPARGGHRVRFAETVYALHAFQKKSTKGIATPARELDLVKARLKQAEALHRKRENQ
jgi:phage-related protein